MSFTVITFIAYEALWFAVVIGAAKGNAWVGMVLSVAFVAWQVLASSQRAVACRLVALAVLLGLLVDGGANGLGLVRYASDGLALPPGGAPLWILGLWGAFGVTMVSAFRWIAGRPIVAAILGAMGGPLSYMGAQRGWGAVEFISPTWHALVYLAAGWAIALAVLALAAARFSPRATSIERRG